MIEPDSSLGRERQPASTQAQQTGGSDEQSLIVVAAAEGDSSDFIATKSEGFGGEIASGEGAVAVGDLVEAGVAASATAGGIEAAAERGGARDSGEGFGFGRVENGVRLGVAFTARGALEPNDVATSVEDHVEISRRGSDAEAGEVLAAALGETGDDGAAEAGACSERGERVDTEGIAVESESEEMSGGFVGRE